MEAAQLISNFNATEDRTGMEPAGASALIPGYRESRRTRTMELVLENSVRDLWPYLCDTDRIEREAGFSPATYTWQDNRDGRLLRGKASLPGGVEVEYTEMPFEWEYLQWHSLERVFHKGPFLYFCGRFDFQELPDHRTKLTIAFHYIPRYRLLPAGLLLKGFMKAIRGAIQKLDANVTAEIAAKAAESDGNAHGDVSPISIGSFEQAGLGAANPTDEALKKRIRELEEKWSHLTPDSAIPARLSEFFLTRPEAVTARMRPFETAEYLELDPMDTLIFCLRAVKDGHLELSWDILCPSCRGTADQGSSLSLVGAETHCEACDIRYDVEFDKHVELTFRPAPSLRVIDGNIFCPAAPARTRHVLSQHFVLPGEERSIHPRDYVDDATHEFILKSDDAGDIRRLEANLNAAPHTLDLAQPIAGPGAVAQDAAIPLNAPLRLRNSGSRVRILKLESTRRDARIATADIVTSLQEFRSLFSSEVLRPGVQLGVAGLTIMFSDLKDSTRMYEVRGDAPAFALVQDHFDRLTEITAANHGAVVKTIGDAVMAVFKDPADAIRAGLRILADEDGDMVVKLGLHSGPCIALNLNERLDYFGSTVNRAARLQGQARGGDLVISEELFGRPEVRKVLKEFKREIRVSRFQAILRGMEGGNTLYRIRPAAASANAPLAAEAV